MAKSRRLSDEELRVLCENEITSASHFGADLANERSKSMDMYMGQPMGNEVEDRSQVVTREVLDTVEWVLPSLMRTFADAENVCIFTPTGPEDDERAQQETDAVDHVFWQQNSGLLNLYSFIKDGLLQKNGILKVWWDETPDEEREEYNGLNEWELAELLTDANRDTEVVDYATGEDGTYDITINVRKANGKIRIMPCPPEEFGISRDANSVLLDEATFLYHRTRKTKAELVEMGYPMKKVKDLPSNTGDEVLTQERLARRSLTDEREDYDTSTHWSMDRLWITECYVKLDRNDDGNASLHKVVLAGQDSNYGSGSTLLGVEEVDRQPFVTWTPVIRTHTFYGLSLADLVQDLQQIKTVLTRQVIDATFLANNARTAVNSKVNLDDLLTSRPGGIVRVTGEEPPSASVSPLLAQPVPPQAFEMLNYLDEMRKSRTGVGDQVGALDGSELAQMNTGVAALAYDASRSKIELMARLCAEIGIRPLFLRIHELLRKNSDSAQQMKMGNRWVEVRPQEWRTRTDMTVQVGVGKVSRERRLVALESVLEKQSLAVQGGGMGVLVNPINLHKAVSDYTKELGLEESLYWMNPEEAQPQEPEPDYQAAMVQVQQGAVEAQMQRNQVEALKVQSTERMRMAELEQKEREMAARVEVQRLTTDLGLLKDEREQSDKEGKAMIDAEIKAREQELKAAELRLKDNQEQAKREVEMYKALLASSTTLTREQMGLVGVQGGPVEEPIDVQSIVASMSGEIGELRAQLMEEREAKKAPKLVKRDKQGLIVAIGDTPVMRDESGQVLSIG